MKAVRDFIFLGSKITMDGDCSHEIKRHLRRLDSVLNGRDIILLTKVYQSYPFSSGHVWMWELCYKEGWAPKNWYFWAVVLEKIFESPLDCKEIQPVHPKGNQSWIFIGSTDAEAEVLILWPPDVKSQLIGKDPDGKDWRQEKRGITEDEMVGRQEKRGITEDEMVGWHHLLNGHEFEQTLGDGEGREAWCAAVHGVTKSQTGLSDWTTATKAYTLVSVHTLYT